MLRTARHWLILVLFVFLPFHALFVTAGTKAILGPGHAPLAALAIWKELLLIVLFAIGIAEIAPSLWRRIYQYTSILVCPPRSIMRVRWVGDTPTALGVALVLLALAVAILSRQSLSDTSFVFGFRYTLLPLIFFLLLRNLAWDGEFFEKRLFPALMAVGGIVALYGVVTFFLPQGFFTALGYGDAHSLYAPNSPLAAFQKISGTGIRRIQGTFAGPNQFGLWLLIPFSLGLVFRRKFPISNFQSIFNFQFFRRFLYLLLIGAVIFLTFSRSAWVAAFVIAVVACGMLLRGRTRAVAFSSVVGVAVVALVLVATLSPQLLQRGVSNRHHVERVRAGIVAMVEKPLGHGLGTAGPASNRVNDPCVYFDEGADIGWAKDRPDLCLFIAGAQAQPSPSERTCTCPVLPENWYLQVGYELGVAGFVLFIALIVSIIRIFEYSNIRNDWSMMAVFLVFIGLSIAALFLHAFEDSAVAYTVWGLTGIALSGVTSNPRAAVPAGQTPFAHRLPRT